jgi:Flp pilus assembly protein TadG
MRALGLDRSIRFFRRLARDEVGAVLVYVSLALTVFLGFAALVIDGGRIFATDTEMQSAADALALAGAAELDGNADAQARADLAMANLVQNDQRFAEGASAITGFSRRFLSALPDDDQPLSDATVATDDTDTRFVEVTLTTRDVDSIFATAIGAEDDTPTGAVAVAGFTQAVCKFTPLFMCNPYPTEEALLDKLADWDNPSNADRRRLINLKKWSGNGQLSPGNFGFLDAPGQHGAAALRNGIAVDTPQSCFSQTGVDLHQGNVASVRQALNTRFDLYEGSYNNKKNDVAYRPAMDVVKGYTVQSGNACNQNDLDLTNAQALPNDTNWTQLANTTGARWGDGNWDCAAYWAWNHGPDHTTSGDPAKPSGCSTAGSTTMSRYDLYRWEVTNRNSSPSGIPNMSSLSPKGENGNPSCYKNGTQNSTLTDPSNNENDIDRRTIYAAVLDCSALPNGNSTPNMPALAFIKMFVTRPMAKNSNSCNGNGGFDSTCEEDATDLFVEIIDKVNPGSDDAVIHDIVQLYR